MLYSSCFGRGLDDELTLVLSAYLRVDVGVPDALVQQLPHGALEARADLLRLVRNVQVRHPQLQRPES